MADAVVHSRQLKRPDLTLPDEEAVFLSETYKNAGVILEFGSGGSTVLAAEQPGKHVMSVESDRSWVRKMKRWFAANPPAEGTTVDIIYADIGPTKAWGHPEGHSAWHRFARYPLSIWGSDRYRHPDVVLVDGRFRIGCALATAFHVTRPVSLLFDDYTNRSRNKQVEEFLGAPRRIVGRMAEFAVAPIAVPADRLMKIIRFMQRP